jgi:PAS domain S-box-containing protein
MALRATLIYFVAAGAWILLSDLALEVLVRDPAAITTVQTYKGFLFVFVSSAILFVVWHRQWARWRAELCGRKQAEESIRFQAHMLDQVGQAVIATHLDGRVLYTNRSALELFGRSDDGMLGKNVLELVVPQASDAQAARIMDELRAGRAWSGEIQLRRRDGSTFPALINDAPLFDERGQVVAIVGVCTDLTEHKSMESRARQSQKLEAVGTLAGGIAHDFNNIVAAILGNAELARSALGPGHPERQSIEHIVAASHRARDLIRQLLAFSRQQDDVPHVECRLEPLVSEALDLLRPTVPPGIRLELEIAPDLPPVLADPTQVHQVVMNLCTNALQAIQGPEGRVAVSLQLVHCDDPRTHGLPKVEGQACVQLSVTDTGSGMDATTLERIFEPFFTTKEPWRGTGLGLAVVHGIVGSHSGAILVESQPGKGTRFDVLFPAVAENTAVAESVPSEVRRGNGEHVLFVDDEPALLHVGQLVLEAAGYQVEVAKGSGPALELLRSDRPFDLLVTDLLMPEMTGEELARQALALRPDLKILLSTGVGGPWTAERCRASGFAALVEKPWSAQGLTQAVQRALPPRGP